MDLETTATLEMVENTQERLEKELLGAWRAGYDYLYLRPDFDQQVRETDYSDLQFTVSYGVKPSNTKLRPDPTDVNHTLIEYDLKGLTRGEVKEHT